MKLKQSFPVCKYVVLDWDLYLHSFWRGTTNFSMVPPFLKNIHINFLSLLFTFVSLYKPILPISLMEPYSASATGSLNIDRYRISTLYIFFPKINGIHLTYNYIYIRCSLM